MICEILDFLDYECIAMVGQILEEPCNGFTSKTFSEGVSATRGHCTQDWEEAAFLHLETDSMSFISSHVLTHALPKRRTYNSFL